MENDGGSDDDYGPNKLFSVNITITALYNLCSEARQVPRDSLSLRTN